MGDRISVSFVKTTHSLDGSKSYREESVALFHHWGGRDFLSAAIEYVKELKEKLAKRKKGVAYPIDRLEPQTVMVDFIRLVANELYPELVESNLYLGKDGDDGDNSDNGHWCIDLETGLPEKEDKK